MSVTHVDTAYASSSIQSKAKVSVPSEANNHNPFLSLPGEIRNEIYNHLMLKGTVYQEGYNYGLDLGYQAGGRLRLVCRQLYHEMALQPFKHSAFKLGSLIHAGESWYMSSKPRPRSIIHAQVQYISGLNWAPCGSANLGKQCLRELLPAIETLRVLMLIRSDETYSLYRLLLELRELDQWIFAEGSSDMNVVCVLPLNTKHLLEQAGGVDGMSLRMKLEIDQSDPNDDEGGEDEGEDGGGAAMTRTRWMGMRLRIRSGHWQLRL